uniref:Uncharacterized protein n=1 Tax=viral metagenome TaxID=1070528 RepID=A0A6C0DUS9_9ZZZZ
MKNLLYILTNKMLTVLKKKLESLFYITEEDNCENSLQTRMKHYLSRYNSECHYYKPRIISLKSKKLLFFVNHLTTLDEKLEILKEHNQMLIDVCSKLYKRFDPHMIYTFNNEIHLVFYYNDEGDVLYYGDVNKLITSIVSYASVYMEKKLSEKGMNIDFIFNGEFVEFDKDYETLNYIIWRQLDCKRNNTVLLYRCLKQSEILDNKLVLDKIKNEEMIEELKTYKSIDESIFNGNIIKRQLYYKERSSKDNSSKKIQNNKESKREWSENGMYTRKRLVVDNINLVDNFKENAKKYIYNKVM